VNLLAANLFTNDPKVKKLRIKPVTAAMILKPKHKTGGMGIKFESFSDSTSVSVISDNVSKQIEAKKIMTEYIFDGCPHPINISGKQRQSLLKAYKKWTPMQSISKLFQSTWEILAAEIIFDVFPRFMMSNLCYEIAYRYLEDKTVIDPIVAISYPIKDDFFQAGPAISDKDIEFFVETLTNSPNFELIYDSTTSSRQQSKNNKGNQNITCIERVYQYPTDWLTNITLLRKFTTYKMEGILPYSLKHCIHTLCNYENLQKFIPHANGIQVLRQLNDSEFLQEYLQQQKKMNMENEISGLLMKRKRKCNLISMDFQYDINHFPRKFIYSHTADFDPQKKEFVSCMKSSPYLPLEVHSKFDYNRKHIMPFCSDDGEVSENESVLVMLGIKLFVLKYLSDSKTLLQIIDIHNEVPLSSSFLSLRSLTKQFMLGFSSSSNGKNNKSSSQSSLAFNIFSMKTFLDCLGKLERTGGDVKMDSLEQNAFHQLISDFDLSVLDYLQSDNQDIWIIGTSCNPLRNIYFHFI